MMNYNILLVATNLKIEKWIDESWENKLATYVVFQGFSYKVFLKFAFFWIICFLG